MGLLDKLKNVFFEEEYVEVEEPEKPKKPERPKKKEEKIVKKVETPKREERTFESPQVVEETEEKEIFTERELLKPDTTFKLFEDDVFVDLEPVPTRSRTRQEPVIEETPKEEKVPYSNPDYAPSGQNYTPIYGGNEDILKKSVYAKSSKEEHTFHPTPVISPVYGILDKNYKKEDVVDKKDRKITSSYASKKVDLDTVRRKAFGELSNDLGLTGEDSIRNEMEEKKEEPILEDNLLYDMSEVDTTPAVEKVTIADAEEYFEDLGLEYNVDYKDTHYERATGRRVSRSHDEVEKDKPTDEEEEKSKTKQVEVKKDEDDNLEDNLFDLIDSMYEDKE